jgi:hypothetical protein
MWGGEVTIYQEGVPCISITVQLRLILPPIFQHKAGNPLAFPGLLLGHVEL